MRMGWLIIIGTIPIVIVGFLLQDTIRTSFRSLWIVAIVLIVFGILLGLADLLGRRTKAHDRHHLPRRHPDRPRADAGARSGRLALGRLDLSAGSRSATSGPRRRSSRSCWPCPRCSGRAVRDLHGAHLRSGRRRGRGMRHGYGLPETVVATVVAFGVGLAVIAFLMNYIKTQSFLPFVIYRIAARRRADRAAVARRAAGRSQSARRR